ARERAPPRSRRDRLLRRRERSERGREVALLLEREDRLLEPVDGVGREGEAGVGAELVANLLVRHRVLGPALLVRKVALERRAVGEGHADAARERLRVGRILGRLVRDLRG